MTDPTTQLQPKALGALVGSTSHLMMAARIYDESLVASPPTAAEYAFGTFVSLRPPDATDDAALPVGIIANSRLLNPDEGYAGPRLTVPQSQNAIFAPDFLNELGVEVSILLLGTLHPSHGEQSVVREVLPVGTEVATLPPAACHRFHHAANGAFQLRYASLLQETRSLAMSLLQLICQQLSELCTDEERQMIQVLRKHIAWQATFQTM